MPPRGTSFSACCRSPARGHINRRRRRRRRAVGDRQLRPVPRGRLARMVFAVALFRVAAAARVDERDAELTGVVAVDGSLHQGRDVEVDLRSCGIGDRLARDDFRNVGAGCAPRGAALAIEPCRLRFDKRRLHAIQGHRPRRARRAEARLDRQRQHRRLNRRAGGNRRRVDIDEGAPLPFGDSARARQQRRAVLIDGCVRAIANCRIDDLRSGAFRIFV